MPYRIICVVVHGILYYHKAQGYIYILGDEVIQTIQKEIPESYGWKGQGQRWGNRDAQDLLG